MSRASANQKNGHEAIFVDARTELLQKSRSTTRSASQHLDKSGGKPMKKLNCLWGCILLASSFSATARSSECSTPPLKLEGLERARCHLREGVRIEVYQGINPPGLYDTKQFGRRRVDVIQGKDRALVAREVDRINDPESTLRSSIAAPRAPDSIVKRSLDKKRNPHQRWKIVSEIVDYFGAGAGKQGFFVRCYTASRIDASGMTVVGECFDFSEEPTFLRTLDEI